MAGLAGKNVAVLATDGVEQVEMTEPMRVLREAGAKVHLVSPKADHIQGWNHTDKGDTFPVDIQLGQVDPESYDALVLPGGVHNPDQLRADAKAVQFVRHFVESGKPIAAICHGPWTLIEANGVRGRRMTSWPSLKTDLTNAGASWTDEEVVTDRGLVTSRRPDDLPAFCRKMLEEFEEGSHGSRQAANDSAGGMRSAG